jgi:branched-subunit amino acid aminotransferase/4-amino-4-deoxychorismate lyase
VTLVAVALSGRGLVEPDEPAIHVDDEGFLRGRAAFETTRVYAGRPFRLRAHLERLSESAARLGLTVPGGVTELAELALDAAGPGDFFLRLYVTPGREGRGEPVVLALVRELPPDLEELRVRGISLVSVPIGVDPPTFLGGVKSTSYAVNMVVVDEAKRRGADDAVFVGRGGVVLEASTSNLWWRRGDTLHTPALELGILAGVTRATLVEAAPALGYHVEEGVYELGHLAGAEEAFTSSSVREVMPVVALDGQRVGEGRPGPAARALQRALRGVATQPDVQSLGSQQPVR